MSPYRWSIIGLLLFPPSSFTRSFLILFGFFCELLCQYFLGLLMATRFYPSKALSRTKTNFENWIGKFFIKSCTVYNPGQARWLFFCSRFWDENKFKATLKNLIIIIAQKVLLGHMMKIYSAGGTSKCLCFSFRFVTCFNDFSCSLIFFHSRPAHNDVNINIEVVTSERKKILELKRDIF